MEDVFSKVQQYEINTGLEKGLDVSVYATPLFLAVQMREIRKGLEKGLNVSVYANPEYDWFQMEEIRKGMLSGVDISQYASAAYDFRIMREIRQALEEGLDLSKYLSAGYKGEELRQIRKALREGIRLDKYLESGYHNDQLREIRKALAAGVDIDKWIKKEMFGEQIKEIRLGLEEGIPVFAYASGKYNWSQMHEIRLGLEKRLNISQYANPYFQRGQMCEIRLGLEEGLDVSAYAKFILGQTDMRRIRLELLKKKEVGHEEELLETRRVEEKFLKRALLEDKDEKQALESRIKLAVSKDWMQVQAVFKPPEEGKSYSAGDVVEWLKRRGIVYGVREDVIEKTLSGGLYHQKVVVAEGTKQSNGRDGWYEFFVRTDMPRIPKKAEDGSVDYRNVEAYERVEEGQKIVVYHPAEKGKNGKTVYGTPLTGNDGRELPVLTGRGFWLLEDKVTYISKVNGKISYERGRLVIEALLIMKEDITAVTGRIVFEGCVHIYGHVGSNAYIEATEDIIVEGGLDACRLVAGKDILVKGGARSKGDCILQAEGSVSGSFFESVRISAKKGVRANYLMNCVAETDGNVMISGRKGIIMGGTTDAAGGVEAFQAGNSMGITTVINVGLNSKMLLKKQKIEQSITEVGQQLTIFEEAMGRYGALLAKGDPKIEALCDKISQAMVIKRDEMAGLEKEKRELEELVEENSNASVKVLGTAYHGCLIGVNQAAARLNEDVKYVLFRKKGNKIVILKY